MKKAVAYARKEYVKKCVRTVMDENNQRGC